MHQRSLIALLAPLLAHSLRAQPPAAGLPVRDIAFSRDGRLAASIEGDIWVRDSNGKAWTQLTRGPMWDRQPAWSPDGTTLVFVSDRQGQDDLFRIRVAQPETAERLTTNIAPDLEPTVGADGVIWFVRGRMNDARLWRRAANGDEARVTKLTFPERAPSLNASGDRLAYIQRTETGNRIRVRTVSATDVDSLVTSEHGAESIAWSPDGERIAFTSHTTRDALYVTPRNGRYVNFVAAAAGDVAWSPDGRTILIAERDDDETGYNGDCPTQIVCSPSLYRRHRTARQPLSLWLCQLIARYATAMRSIGFHVASNVRISPHLPHQHELQRGKTSHRDCAHGP
jgi:Tol biopolymer transport system component